MQYWCIDGKDTIYVARLRNKGKTSFSEFLIIKKRSRKPHLYLNSSSGKGRGLISLLG